MFEELDFKKGIIIYDDFNIDFTQPLNNQLFSLKEDLFQVQYSNENNLIIDIGWYPEMDLSGYFITYVIKNNDWEEPLFKKKSKTLENLTKTVEEAINLVTTVYS